MALNLMYHSKLGPRLVSHHALSKTLVAMSAHEGRSFDKPLSVHKIPDFVQTYGIDMGDVLKPLGGFTDFNDFFVSELNRRSALRYYLPSPSPSRLPNSTVDIYTP